MNKINLAICILFFEKAAQTIECVQSFLGSGVPIYILNNNSSQESTQILKDFCQNHSQVKIFDSPENLGVSRGRNFLINNTMEDWMLFVDNDIIVVTDGWLNIIENEIGKYPEAEVFIPKLFNKHTGVYSSRNPFKVENNILSREVKFNGIITNIFSGGASFINRRLFERNGLYDEEMFVGFEDYEFALRALFVKKPIVAKIMEEIELIHDHRAAFNEKEKASARERYDLKHHKKSYAQIVKKYGVKMEYDWKYWLKIQQNFFATGKRINQYSFFRRIYNKLRSIYFKIT